jgi:hypothetical protein
VARGYWNRYGRALRQFMDIRQTTWVPSGLPGLVLLGRGWLLRPVLRAELDLQQGAKRAEVVTTERE